MSKRKEGADKQNDAIRIAVASGKGGTGKTTIATNLAIFLATDGIPVVYADCDVEEPNGHIFLHPLIEKRISAGVPIPEVDTGKCTGCGLCGEMCQYSAIVCIKGKVLTFPELCHGCGGCTLICPEDAIAEVQREVGQIQTGTAGPLRFVNGILRVGEAMSPPLIRAVKENLIEETPNTQSREARDLQLATRDMSFAIIDAPPGTSCPVIEAVKDTDFVLLVTEPTPFGLNDLKLAVEMIRELGIPFGVVINRCDVGTGETRRYCEQENIRVLMEIPHDRRIAEAYSRGQLAINMVSDFAVSLEHMRQNLLQLIEMKSKR